MNFDSWEHNVGKQSDLYCRSFRVLEASATLTCPTSRTGSSLPPEAAPCIRKTVPRGPKEHLATYQEAQVSLCTAELSFMVVKRKQTQRKDSETPPGQRGPLRLSWVVANEPLGLFQPFQVERWPLYSQLSLAPVVPRFGFNFFHSSISFLSHRQLQPKPL